MSKQQQIARENHYVPQWYQRGFLAKGQHKLQVLNLNPSSLELPNAPALFGDEVEELGTKLAFKKADLYTTRFGETLNDDIEKYLFGMIDKSGADAVRSWIAGDTVKIHRKFQDFFAYMDAQKLRTPKGLDWISKHFQGLPQMDLMEQMQALRQMHCTMWSEGVREIVSAKKSRVKFLVSDHPVTIYHPKLPPNAVECQYPDDPSIDLVGSQTIFALDANHCLILTNLEYAQDSEGAALLSRRTNARYRGDSMARTDTFIRDRELGEEDVHAINLVLKSRAKKYVAASNAAWLYPEQHCNRSWDEIAKILLPRDELWRFGGEVYIGYEDGTSAYRDPFGRTSKAHEFLAKPPLTQEPLPDGPCGCGSGTAFRDCCADVAVQKRPSWRVMGIRERNLALLRAIDRIFGLNSEQTTWLDVRRNLSNNQVSKIHEVFAALWPTDTQLIDLLPTPQSKRSRALYLGIINERALSTVLGILAYVDELILVHPFVNANGIRPEYNPIHHPEQFRKQTIRSVLLLKVLERHIKAGRIHLVPDPLDYVAGFRSEIKEIAARSGEIKVGPIDEARLEKLWRYDRMQNLKRLPMPELKAYIKEQGPQGSEEMTEDVIEAVARLWKEELEQDPWTSLDPLPLSSEGGELTAEKGFTRETGLYIATLSGAIVYTDSDTQWARLHETDGVHHHKLSPANNESVRTLDNLYIRIPKHTYYHEVEPEGASETRALLRRVAVALRAGSGGAVNMQAAAGKPPQRQDEESVVYKLRPSAPLNGFQRTDVSRLVLTFGRMEDVTPVRLALFLERVSRDEPVQEASGSAVSPAAEDAFRSPKGSQGS